jgi:hypothetical protein
MKLSSICAAAVILFWSGHAFSDDGTIKSETERLFQIDRPLGRNLHQSRHVFPDGAKGIYYYYSSESPPGNPEKYGGIGNLNLFFFSCKADLVVLAKAISSTSEILQDKSAIYTTYQFNVIDTVKNDTTGHSKAITVVRLGGTVSDANETLRVEVQGTPPYNIGGTYLLFLSANKLSNPLVFRADDYNTFSFKNNRIYTSPRDWDGILSGSNYADIKSNVSHLLQEHSCQKPTDTADR